MPNQNQFLFTGTIFSIHFILAAADSVRNRLLESKVGVAASEEVGQVYCRYHSASTRKQRAKAHHNSQNSLSKAVQSVSSDGIDDALASGLLHVQSLTYTRRLSTVSHHQRKLECALNRIDMHREHVSELLTACTSSVAAVRCCVAPAKCPLAAYPGTHARHGTGSTLKHYKQAVQQRIDVFAYLCGSRADAGDC